MKVITVDEMRKLEGESIRRCQAGMPDGVSGREMMAIAGAGAAECLRAWIRPWSPEHRRRVVILTGKGNNGGDGWVMASVLSQSGFEDVCVYSVCPREELMGDAAVHASLLPRGVAVVEDVEILPPEAFAQGAVVVDALLGTGFHGEVRGRVASWIRQVNESHCPVMSLDVPSGLDADTGEGGGAIHADVTVTMCFPKVGLFRKDGPKCCGHLEVVGIGLPEELMDSASGVGEAFGMSEVRMLVGKRQGDGYKGTFGHVLCLGGSRSYSGAPALSALGAVRGGAGLVTLAVPGGCSAVSPLFSLIFRKLGSEQDGAFSAGMMGELQSLTAGKQAVVFGPGIGREASPDFLAALLDVAIPMVIDADGLRLLAAYPQLLPRTASAAVVLTPHRGEMDALMRGFGVASELPEEQAFLLARKTGAVVVLKGPFSIVASPDGGVSRNLSGGVALATAGSGDVLSGVIGALLGNGMAAKEAAQLGVFIHGLAGDSWNGARRSLSADELPGLVSEAWLKVTPLA